MVNQLGINNYIDISENAEITIEEGVTINRIQYAVSKKWSVHHRKKHLY